MALALGGATAVVTGASRGIGACIARALAAAGARVAILARSRGALEDEARAIGDLALPIACDLSDAGEVASAIGTVQGSLGVPDILVNNAGIFALAAMGEMPARDAERMFAVNLLAPYTFANAFVPGMRARGSGHVLTIGSTADRYAVPENAVYAAGKFGGRAMHQVMRDELRGSGVRTSLISPGPVDTTLWDTIDPDARPGFTPRASMLRALSVADALMWCITRPADVNIDELRLTRA